jgi:pimeloyl-ACP methyl ester carboxylesterase
VNPSSTVGTTNFAAIFCSASQVPRDHATHCARGTQAAAHRKTRSPHRSRTVGAGTLDVFHYADNRNRKLGYQLLADGERYEAYPDFAQPALIFHGVHDDVVPARYSEEFAATHAYAALEVLDAGHDLLNVLDYMAPKIVRFLTD